MSLEDSLSWPLVMEVELPAVGDALTGAAPAKLSSDLAAASWASSSGTIGTASLPSFVSTPNDETSWQNPSAPAFFCSSGSTATDTIPLALGLNRGVALYVGFSCERWTDFSGYQTDPGLSIELRSGGGSVLASMDVHSSAADTDRYLPAYFEFDANVYGAAPKTILPPGDEGYWANPWVRTLALSIDQVGRISAGFFHPAYSGPSSEHGSYQDIGFAQLAEIASMRLTVSPHFALTYIQAFKVGMTPAGATNYWWRNRVYSIEVGADTVTGQPGNDWGPPI
ncbi:MAG: hypothetical protein KDD75_12800 [Caldilineaceae bacterium]|nr:hypothetical protein [Caldilineaceae bacterium]